MDTKKQSIKELGENLLPYLAEWKYDYREDTEWRVRLMHGHKRIHLRFNKKRLEATGSIENGKIGRHRNYMSARITCSTSKTPQQIARDIERRIIPELQIMEAKCLEEARLYRTWKEGFDARANLLTKLFPSSSEVTEYDKNVYLNMNGQPLNFTINDYFGRTERITVDLHLTLGYDDFVKFIVWYRGKEEEANA